MLTEHHTNVLVHKCYLQSSLDSFRRAPDDPVNCIRNDNRYEENLYGIESQRGQHLFASTHAISSQSHLHTYMCEEALFRVKVEDTSIKQSMCVC